MTGWTWEHVDKKMTIPMLFAMQSVWDLHPPPAVCLKIVALANGMKEPKKKKTKKGENAGASRDVAMALQG